MSANNSPFNKPPATPTGGGTRSTIATIGASAPVKPAPVAPQTTPVAAPAVTKPGEPKKKPTGMLIAGGVVVAVFVLMFSLGDGKSGKKSAPPTAPASATGTATTPDTAPGDTTGTEDAPPPGPPVAEAPVVAATPEEWVARVRISAVRKTKLMANGRIYGLDEPIPPFGLRWTGKHETELLFKDAAGKEYRKLYGTSLNTDPVVAPAPPAP